MSELRWALLIIGLLILAGIYFYHQWRAHIEVKNIFQNNEPEDKDVLLDEEAIVEDVVNLNEESASDESRAAGAILPSYSSTTEIDPLIESDIHSGIHSDNDSEMRTEPDLFSTPDAKSDLDIESEQPTEPVPQQAVLSGLPEKLSMVVMHIVAEKDEPFAGEAIIKALQAHKLRFGEHRVFHRILDENSKKLTVYSVTSMVKPGTLDPEELKDMKLPGMTLILNLPAPVESLKAYDDMLHAAQHMASTLGGTLMDEDFMTLSREKIALDRAKLF